MSHTPFPEKSYAALYTSVFADPPGFLTRLSSRVALPDAVLTTLSPEGEVLSALTFLPYAFRTPRRTVSCAYLFALMTRPDCRRKGLMSDLLHRAVLRARAEGCAFLFLLAEPHAAAFYRHAGFRPFGRYGGLVVRTALPDDVPRLAPTAEHAALLHERYLHFTARRSGLCLSPEAWMAQVDELRSEHGFFLSDGDSFAFVLPENPPSSSDIGHAYRIPALFARNPEAERAFRICLHAVRMPRSCRLTPMIYPLDAALRLPGTPTFSLLYDF